MKPNVLLIVMDTARADYVNSMYNDIEITPNIKQIAESGTEFTNSFATAPWTLPSHASLFTGQYSNQHGAHAGNKQLKASGSTLPEIFQDSGYETFGISNNAWISESFGFSSGFDTFNKGWLRFQTETDPGETHLTKSGREKYAKILKDTFSREIVKNVANILHRKLLMPRRKDDGAQQTIKLIREWLGSRGRSPFFLFINFLEPHLEYHPPKEYCTQFLPSGVSYEDAMSIDQDPWKYLTNQVDIKDEEFDILRALYAAELFYLDKKIGELRDIISKSSTGETIWVIVGDHGEHIGHNQMMDHQYSLSEDLLHVPFIIEAEAFDSHEDTRFVNLLDIPETLIDLTNIDRGKFVSEGKSLCGDAQRKYTLAEYMAPQPSLTEIRKEVGDPHDVMERFDRSLQAVRSDDFKLVRSSNGEDEFFKIEDHQEISVKKLDYPEKYSELVNVLDSSLPDIKYQDTGKMDADQDVEGRLKDLGYL